MFALYNFLGMVPAFWMWNLLGQAVLAVLAGSKRHQNVVYKLIAALNIPVFWVTRKVTLGIFPEPHLGFVALFLVILARLVLYSVFFYFGWIPDVTAPPSSSAG
jgi:hypothetical protein